jgi:hypothetical protein
MRRSGLTLILGVLLLGGCATDAPAVPADTPVEIVRTGGDMQIDDRLVIQPDGSWSYTSAKEPSRSGRLSTEKIAAARAILDRPGFAEELSVADWDANCIDPPTVAVTIGDRTTKFVSCDDPDQKNMNELLQLLLEEIYNKAG